MKRYACVALLAFVAGCTGTTGSEIVGFQATAGGLSTFDGGALTFRNGFGADVTLEKARATIGAVYLLESVPISGGAAQPCIVSTLYVAESFGPVEVDLLSPTPVPFPVRGRGTATRARTAQVWLGGRDINAAEDPTAVLTVEGTAVQAGKTIPFSAKITIGGNRALGSTNPALPGANPICKMRIVTPIATDLVPTDGGTLALSIDPRAMFNAVDFSSLDAGTARAVIPDNAEGVGGALYRGLMSPQGVYSFTWK